MPGQSGVAYALLYLVVFAVVAKGAGRGVITVEIGARRCQVSAQVQLQVRSQVIAHLPRATADLAAAMPPAAEIPIEAGDAAGAVVVARDAPHELIRCAADSRRAIARIVRSAFEADAARGRPSRIGGDDVDDAADRITAVQR